MRKRDEDLHRLHDGELEGAAPALDDADRERLAALGEISAAVKNTLAAEASGVDLWAAIEKRIDQNAAKKGPVDIRSWRQRIARRAYVLVPAIAAAAAAVLVWWNLGTGPVTNGCDIEELDISGATATVFKVGEGTGSTTVIWTEGL